MSEYINNSTICIESIADLGRWDSIAIFMSYYDNPAEFEKKFKKEHPLMFEAYEDFEYQINGRYPKGRGL